MITFFPTIEGSNEVLKFMFIKLKDGILWSTINFVPNVFWEIISIQVIKCSIIKQDSNLCYSVKQCLTPSSTSVMDSRLLYSGVRSGYPVFFIWTVNWFATVTLIGFSTSSPVKKSIDEMTNQVCNIIALDLDGN